ncbi:MAG: glycine/betaine ABC transporter [Bacteroidia bacterium]|nr:MAG: glycine/betaine ABC transporter [Bacteroidia bacterium]
MRLPVLPLILALPLLLFGGCGGRPSGAAQPAQPTVSLAYIDGWAEAVAMSFLMAEVLKEQGYEVRLRKATNDMIFASLANGDLDVFMDVWYPSTNSNRVKKFGDRIERVGVNFDSARLGLVVPDYVPIASIEELNAHAERLGGRIVGIESGSALVGMTGVAIDRYGLELRQVTSSTVAMLAELQKAIAEKRWIVVTAWQPHWMFGRYPLRFLDDPQKVYDDTERIETYCRRGFMTDDPRATRILERFHLSPEQMASLLLRMEGKGSPAELARGWMEENRAVVGEWVGE